MDFPSPRQNRKRRRCRDPEDPSAAKGENGVKKRTQTHEPNTEITDQPRRHTNGIDGVRINGAAAEIYSNVQLINSCAATEARLIRQTGQTDADGSFRRASSSALQNQMHPVRNKSSMKVKKSTTDISSPILTPPAQPAEEDDNRYCAAMSNDFGKDGQRGYVKIMMAIYLVANVVALIFFSAVFYTIDYVNKLDTMEKSSLYYDTIETYSSLLRKSSEKATRHEAKMIASQQQNSQLKHAMKQMEMEHTAEIEKYKSIFKQHDTDMNEALSHIKVLRGKKEDKLSALNLAWLKLDELLEENNELSHHLNDAKRQQLFVARDRELINTVESLTQQLKTVSEDKDNLTAVYDDVNIVLMHMNKEYELLEFRHHQMTDTLTPILTYIQRLLRTSEQQHAIILELTSLVHSLHSSLELSKSDAQIQSTESQYAIDAIAAAAGEAVAQQTARYEMERAIYMEDMEMKLARTEDEAFGAVQAVAEAAGKLEYERKIEEETRWRTYVEEVENTLGEIGVQTEHDLSSRGQNHEEISSETVTDKKDTNKMRGNLDDLQGIVETSVLRAAISRRIEEGIASLQRYIHPYNYLKEKKSYSWEIKSEPEQ